MTETIRTIIDLLNKECEPSVVNKTEALADWYKKASTIYLQTEILYKDLSSFDLKCWLRQRFLKYAVCF